MIVTQADTSRKLHAQGIYPFVLLLLVDVLALVFEKLASIQAGGNGLIFYVHLLQQPWMWLSLGLGPIQLLIWKTILTKTELSLAYPLSSLCYPLTMLTGILFFNEHLDRIVWLGGLLITAGAALLKTEH